MLTPQRYKCQGIVCSQASIKTGLRYEEKICREIARIFPGWFEFQARTPDGIIDALYSGAKRPRSPADGHQISAPANAAPTNVPPPFPIIVEIKLTQTADAYYQLLRYARSFPLAAKIIVTKTIVREIRVPDPPVYLMRLEDIQDVVPNSYYIIPHQGKISK